MRKQPFASPEEALKHYGVKGMRWGVRKEEETSGRDSGRVPDFESRVRTLARTDKPQVIREDQERTADAPRSANGRVQRVAEGPVSKDGGLSREQKMLLTFGAVAAAGAGYYAYSKYVGGNPAPFGDLFGKGGAEAARLRDLREFQELEGMTLPKHWDMRTLKDGPISTKPLGMLGHGNPLAEYDFPDELVVNTSRGYAEFLPKWGLGTPYAKAQRDSMVRVLEDARAKYPAIRNMNIELAPMSAFSAVGTDAQACVLPMGPGEARLFYNDMISAPTQTVLSQNKSFLPGLGAKDYVAQHELGHLFAVANGQLPPAKEFLSDNPPMKLWETRAKAEPILHKKMFEKHGFTFHELSKISGYAATQPAEAMAELVGHYLNPEMRKRLTEDQIRRAGNMIDEMGGLG